MTVRFHRELTVVSDEQRVVFRITVKDGLGAVWLWERHSRLIDAPSPAALDSEWRRLRQAFRRNTREPFWRDQRARAELYRRIREDERRAQTERWGDPAWGLVR